MWVRRRACGAGALARRARPGPCGRGLGEGSDGRRETVRDERSSVSGVLCRIFSGPPRPPAGIRRKRAALGSSCASNPGRYVGSPGPPSKNLRYARAPGRPRSRVWNRPTTGSPEPGSPLFRDKGLWARVPKRAEAHRQLVLHSRGCRARGLSPIHDRVLCHDRRTHIKPLASRSSGPPCLAPGAPSAPRAQDRPGASSP
jgi:hypothetical protein